MTTTLDRTTLVLHATWTAGGLCVWAEDGSAFSRAGSSPAHPYANVAAELRMAMADVLATGAEELKTERIRLRLPSVKGRPIPSDRLEMVLGEDREDDQGAPAIESFEVDAILLDPADAVASLAAIENAQDSRFVAGHEFRFWAAAARFVVEHLARQRIIPTLSQDRTGLRAAWRLWVHDKLTHPRFQWLADSMPAVARASMDASSRHPSELLDEILSTWTDGIVRRAMIRESYADALDGRDESVDPHVAWLHGLLDNTAGVPVVPLLDGGMLPLARQWIVQLDDTGEGRKFHLAMRLIEPMVGPDETPTLDRAIWVLRFSLVSPEHEGARLDAADVWGSSSAFAVAGGLKIDRPQELLLSELGRAGRIYPVIEEILSDSSPCQLELTTTQAYAFLREHRPVLEEAGFVIESPEWWDQPASRLGVRLQIESDQMDPTARAGGASSLRSELGLQSLVKYRWEIALGDQRMSMEEFQRLAKLGSPLVRAGGRWIEVRPDDLAEALEFLEEHPGGETSVLEAIRLAHGLDGEPPRLPVLGMDATGWVAEIFNESNGALRFNMLEQPTLFRGTLRPYQKAGVSWLSFLQHLGIGACLADDMGLGKTIQFIAALQHERAEAGQSPGPTLLIAPMSVISNWHRELERFAPELKAHMHHGIDRPTGDALVERSASVDLVITTYALAARDREALSRVPWHRVALDEAQHIKNPPTKQAAAIRSFACRHRVALTGTPVENRLSELWSIMEFCNPGYLGTAAEFRRRFAAPIERRKDRRQMERLRSLVRPMVLRRLKTDRNVITDLPPLVETKEFATLTAEQASLYETVVREMLQRVDQSTGIQRRGLVLSALVRLKQICNHPEQYLREKTESFVDEVADRHAEKIEGGSGSGAAEPAPVAPGSKLTARSGKTRRLVEMLEEVTAAGDRALVFTQYRQMGHLLAAILRQELDVEPLFLHGGTPQGKRQQLIDRFQSNDPRTPIFILSLKAGGVGLNLTAANHVFHFDRWWNPAVENQATDRAFRIGQTRTVQVHKMISVGTLEERIDQMIEQKSELAEQVIGAGEAWLTELSTSQLRDILTLRRTSLEDEE
jgi:SNF2 family DNA or RNA helicase